MKRSTSVIANIIVAAAVAALTFSGWAYFNRPEHEPPWPAIVPGFSFSPMREGHNPIEHILPSAEDIDADLALLKGKAHAVRTYSVEGNLAEVPALAARHKLNVTLGAWVGEDEQRSKAELAKVIELSKARRNVVRVIVGNEVVLRNEIPVEQLIDYIEQARKALKGRAPVSTAEPWHVWIRHPELADHVDFLTIHLLPYWEGIELDAAVEFAFTCIKTLRQAFPKKPIVVGEVGWPSNGRTRRAAVASVSNQAAFLRRFIERAEKEKLTYYLMEAFDQPWKRDLEGAVGAYWGVYDANRQPKFAFTEPIIGIPHWRWLAAASVGVALITLALLLIDSHTLKGRGRGFLAVMAYAAATLAVWVVYDYTQQYLTASSVTVGVFLIIGMAGVIVVILAEAHEWAEALWVRRHRRTFTPETVEDDRLPMVSVHVPAYNEPPEMLKATLDGLAALNYPRFEVLVIDNNTKNPAIWQPVADHCARLGPRFRFFHVDPLDGFKAGALNYALERTDPEAAVVAVIDSDYIVNPDWLRDLCPRFADDKIAIVQAPQDYRDFDQNAFKAMCYSEYSGFFFIGMVTRNERNAIIQHGTMTLVRRSVLDQVGGWAKWCITEDAELGLRIFEKGHEALYIPKSYGKGVMPDTFLDFKKQRFRWAYGSVQILKRHAAALLTTRAGLTPGQRYHFIAGWLPWMADGINLVFNLAALGWSAVMIAAPTALDPPLVVFSSLPLAFFIFKIAKLFDLYHALVGATLAQTLAAGLAGLSLSHTIARAMLIGAITGKLPFFRTPKLADTQLLKKAVAACREEVLIMIALWLAAGAIGWRHGTDTPDLLLWVLVLLTQSLPYLAALVVSLISALPAFKLPSIGAISLLRLKW